MAGRPRKREDAEVLGERPAKRRRKSGEPKSRRKGGPLSPVERRKIAVMKLAGASCAEIAEEIGCSISTVQHFQGNPENRSLIARLVEKHEKELAKLFADSIKSAAKDLNSRDVAARSNARREALGMITAADRLYLRAAAGGGTQVNVNVGPGAGEHSLQEMLLAVMRGQVVDAEEAHEEVTGER